MVVLFERGTPDPRALRRWLSSVPDTARVLLVLPEPTTADLPVDVLADPVQQIADALRMPAPVDGGYPIGYAVVDADRRLRYATLDPRYLENAFEVDTIVRAVS